MTRARAGTVLGATSPDPRFMGPAICAKWKYCMKNHILNIRDANMFHNGVINFWNKLPDSVVLAASISSFKRLLLSFVVNVGFEHFSVN